MPPTSSLPTRRRLLAAALAPIAAVAAVAPVAPAWAGALERPKGKVVLSLTGKVSQVNAEGRADFDMDMLARLPQSSFTTRTPWDKEPRRFSGPLLRDVLAAAGAQGSRLQAIALNDYRIEIPVEDARLFDVIVARLLDDQPMRVRDRGPLFIIYPFDSKAELRAQRYYARACWQLRSLDVQ